MATPSLKEQMLENEYQAKLEGIAMGWQECLDVLKSNMPPVIRAMEDLIKDMSPYNQRKAQLALEKYYKSARTKEWYSLEDLRRVMEIAWIEGRTHQANTRNGRVRTAFADVDEFIQEFIRKIILTGEINWIPTPRSF